MLEQECYLLALPPWADLVLQELVLGYCSPASLLWADLVLLEQECYLLALPPSADLVLQEQGDYSPASLPWEDLVSQEQVLGYCSQASLPWGDLVLQACYSADSLHRNYCPVFLRYCCYCVS